MLRKITAVLMLSAFTHVSAMTPVARTADLNNSFNELNYSLNVEWDQKDQSFFDASVDEFEKDIAELQKQGLSNTELLDYTLDKIKDKKTRDEVNAIVDVVKKSDMTQEEARAFVLSKLSSTYANGASWMGGRMGMKMALLLGIIIIIALVSEHDDDEDESHCTTYGDFGCNEIDVDVSLDNSTTTTITGV